MADEAFVASPFFPARSRVSFDNTISFGSDPAAFIVSLGGGEGNIFLDLTVPRVSVDDGNLTKGVPSARVIRRGSGQDCWGVTGSWSSGSFARAFGIYTRRGGLSRDAIGVYRLLRL